MKFRSHWPSVTPSARVLVRLPLHVILIVEAAFASAVAPRKSERMQRNVRCFDICDHNSDGRYYVRILANRLWLRQWSVGTHHSSMSNLTPCASGKIGRASCRERGEISVAVGFLKDMEVGDGGAGGTAGRGGGDRAVCERHR